MAGTPQRPPKEANGRPRRFVLPVDDDVRAAESIEGFLVGHRPRRRSPSPASVALRGRGSSLVRADPWQALEARLDWLDALDREEARRARYRRPVTIAVLEVRPVDGFPGGSLADALRRFVDLVRRETRATDRITRLGPNQFGLLLPETSELQAAHVIDRLRARTAVLMNGSGGVEVRAGWASPRRDETLREATTKAEARLGGDRARPR